MIQSSCTVWPTLGYSFKEHWVPKGINGIRGSEETTTRSLALTGVASSDNVIESEQVFLSSDKVCSHYFEELQTAKITIDTHLLIPLRSTVIEHL